MPRLNWQECEGLYGKPLTGGRSGAGSHHPSLALRMDSHTMVGEGPMVPQCRPWKWRAKAKVLEDKRGPPLVRHVGFASSAGGRDGGREDTKTQRSPLGQCQPCQPTEGQRRAAILPPEQRQSPLLPPKDREKELGRAACQSCSRPGTHGLSAKGSGGSSWVPSVVCVIPRGSSQMLG